MEQLIVIRTLAELASLEQYLKGKEYVALDTETTGVDKESQVIGISVSADPEVGYYIVLREWNVAEQKLKDLETLAGVEEFLIRLKPTSLIMHNGIFDCWMLENNFKVSLIEHLHTDTMILAHLLDENRKVGLKELSEDIFGEDSRVEQYEMRESVYKNGGVLTKDKYELYKADAELIARYGAKDAILTLKLFYHLVPELYAQGLDAFFYDDESMPLLRGPTYQLNTTGLRIDPDKLQKLRCELETECLELKSYIYKEITPHVIEKYPGTGKTNHFNIDAGKQLSWLLFEKLQNNFHTLTDEGKSLNKYLGLSRLPYALKDKRDFIRAVTSAKGRVWVPNNWVPKRDKDGNRTWWNPDSKKIAKRPKKIGDWWTYVACGKETLGLFSKKYKWVEKLLEYKKSDKLLTVYVDGIQSRIKYNIIRPSFLQHGTTSGRYSSRNPNFQNLPRTDKRVKACIVPRPGNVFVGADYSQLEPRVFASVSGDETLTSCFANGEDFYSVVGAPIFGVGNVSMFKNDENSFAKLHPKLRDASKVVALAAPYGRTAAYQASQLGVPIEEASKILDSYFKAYPKVELMMLESYEMAKRDGVVHNLYGRPRRIPAAKDIVKTYGNRDHSELPYAARTLLNLAMNHRVQSTAASIMNRAAILVTEGCKELGWSDVRLVLQVHDELILEGPEALKDDMVQLLKHSMENAAVLPGVKLEAEPKISNDIAGLK